MICGLETAAPDGPVFRLARAPDPWSWPDWSQANVDGTFANRWDDPESTYRVLYASSTRFGGFLETLSRFRPDLTVIAELQAIEGDGDPVAAGTVPREWFEQRLIGIAELDGYHADIGAATSLALLRSPACGQGNPLWPGRHRRGRDSHHRPSRLHTGSLPARLRVRDQRRRSVRRHSLPLASRRWDGELGHLRARSQCLPTSPHDRFRARPPGRPGCGTRARSVGATRPLACSLWLPGLARRGRERGASLPERQPGAFMRTRNIEFVVSCRFAISDRGRSAALARETGPERVTVG